MRVKEILERDAVGKSDYHPENYFAPIVAEFVNEEGVAYWPDIFAHVELNTDFTPRDLEKVSNRSLPRWQKNVQNLHAHRTLEGGEFGNIVRIKGGFATREAAEEQGIEPIADNSMTPRNPGKRSPEYIKKKVGYVVGTAYQELGKPPLRDVKKTRKAIEDMVRSDFESDERTLIARAQEIIKQGMK